MKLKPTPWQMCLFTVAVIQLTVVGAYVFAALGNGVDDHEMLPFWANFLMLNGSADLLLFLVWLMLSSGGGKGRKGKSNNTTPASNINHASPSASASRACP